MIFWISLIRFPSTFLHELMHFLVAVLLMCRVSGLLLIPRIEKNKVILGSISVIPSFKGALIFVGLAPFLLWGLAFYIWYANITIVSQEITILLTIYMFTGGIPSYQDFKTILEGVFSISGLIVLFIMIFLLHYLFDRIY